MKHNMLIVFTVVLSIPCAYSETVSGATPSVSPGEFYGEYWGGSTNGIKAGLYVRRSPVANNRTPLSCTPVLMGISTNKPWIWLPPAKSRFELELKDEDGNSVPKTSFGSGFGKPIHDPFELQAGVNIEAGYAGRGLIRDNPEMLLDSTFILQDFFAISNSGKYRLEFKMQAIWFPPGWKRTGLVTTNPPLLKLPSVVADIEVETPLSPMQGLPIPILPNSQEGLRSPKESTKSP